MDNLENLKPLITFTNENEYYFIQIFQRRKDNPEMDKGVKRIKSYCVYSMEELNKLYPSIRRYCEKFNARAYIRLNSQDAFDVNLRVIEQISKNIRLKNYKKTRNVWDAISGQGGKTKYWVIDIDKEHLDFKNFSVMLIGEELRHHFENVRQIKRPILCTNPTKTGIHLITESFDTRLLQKINKPLIEAKIPAIELQKDANTVLYTL